MAYDRADFDYSTEGEPLPKAHALTHIGIFMAWAVLNGLHNELYDHKTPDRLERLRRREITGAQFFALNGEHTFSEKDLSPEGNEFATWYYCDDSGQRGKYFEDYRKVLVGRLPSFWHVADTWENYDNIAPVITKRYQDWKNPKKKSWWQFWR
jgi:hypothetical protein